MTNSIHLVAVPESEEGLQQVLKPLHIRMRKELIGHAVGKALCGKAGFSHRPWTMPIYGQRSGM
ncbi:hypothetical protein [Nitrosococcus wardiae]|uniref:Uncharacterized protein n=1 Tax=Nitrosococcus wardiae TaxID=1814290 RepID=A0A4P7BVK2_9GAMM|nr:hypothetical protein [Nitrosococcus wardiae]QBQ53931.1 hypothetical protein E3U44_04940 [Nitrosococcus wardiae]